MKLVVYSLYNAIKFIIQTFKIYVLFSNDSSQQTRPDYMRRTFVIPVQFETQQERENRVREWMRDYREHIVNEDYFIPVRNDQALALANRNNEILSYTEYKILMQYD
jgi:hypothetical protein